MPDVVLSVVVPVYNCENYITELVDSLLVGANTPQVEFVFVDDGSTDASLSRCHDALKRHQSAIRFCYRVLPHEQNRGISAARNTGIRGSTGPYIGFLDGDDVVMPGYAACILRGLTEQLLERKPDIFGFAYREFAHYQELPAEAEPAGDDSPHQYQANQRYRTLFKHGFFVWSRIYRRELVESVMFVEDARAYEDIAFLMDVVARARDVVRIGIPLVGYRQSGASLTAVRDRRFFDQYSQLCEGMRRNRHKFGGGAELESRYLFKLFIILLKALKIRPASDRLEFYRRARAHMHNGGSALSKVSTAASRGLSTLLLFMVSTLRSS